MADRAQTCMFTGHRDIPCPPGALWDRLQGAVMDAYQGGVRLFVAGGAMGFDLLAAEAVVDLRGSHPDAGLWLVLPCKNQHRYYSPDDQRRYQALLDRADRAEYLSQAYYKGCMHERNRRMVGLSGLCICYFTGGPGGTAYTVARAAAQGLRIVNLAQPGSSEPGCFVFKR